MLIHYPIENHFTSIETYFSIDLTKSCGKWEHVGDGENNGKGEHSTE